MNQVKHPILKTFFAICLFYAGPAQATELACSVESVASGVVRFWPKGADKHQFSFALQNGVLPGKGPLQQAATLRPLYRDEGGHCSASFRVPKDWDLYGTGEVAGPLRRNGTEIDTWNTDAFGYGENSTQLYQSHPWVLALAKDGRAMGFLADTTWKTHVSLKDGISFDSDGPAFPSYVLYGNSPQKVLEELASLSGCMPLPPKWALGFQQCRYSYFPDSRVREVASEFRKRKIPCDVIWLDIDYMDGFRIFSFDPKRFPDPDKLNQDLHAINFHTVWMIDPGVKAEPGYKVYDQGSKLGAWVRDARGDPFCGRVWPGDCVFPDFTREEVRHWWGGLYADFMARGVDGVWNDMNEPSVFKSPNKTMPLDNVHGGYGGGPHARFHNVYGMLMAKATREGILAANPGKRPFVLTRASNLGGQRYAATWTGDNTANWTHLAMSVPMVLNLGLSGQPFAGPDIGGFVANSTPKMFARWMGIGALLPFSRAHKMKGSADHEPWALGPEVEKTCRAAIERRYRLLPYLYTVFEESSRTGLPVARPLFFADSANPALRAEESSFLLGGDLCVQTQPLEDREIDHVLPNGKWKELSFEAEKNPDLPRLFLRPGAVLVTGPVVQSTGESVDKLTLYVNLDAHGRAEGWLYEDAGDGYGYQRGEYLRRKFRVQKAGGQAKVSVDKAGGTFQGVEKWDLELL